MHTLDILVLGLAALPAVLFLLNLPLYRLPRPPEPDTPFRASILIPARNEERSIERCLRAALGSRHIQGEILVLDDGSQDATAAIVRAIAGSHPRVRLLCGQPLPQGWCGKQFACSQLAQHASEPFLCFLDADVRLAPDGLWRMLANLGPADLLSGFPRQETKTFLERLLLPLMHFLLLGFLPLPGMRMSRHPSLAAGCGQLMIVRREAYFQAGGHAAIKQSRHDGIMLPRAFRRAGLRTDLRDATNVAVCRMYQNGPEVVSGLLKNATEGIASPGRIVPFTLALLAGQVVPFLLAAFAMQDSFERACVYAACGCALLPRLLAAICFRQPLDGALLQPLAILVFLGLQWRALLGKPVAWKGRSAVYDG